MRLIRDLPAFAARESAVAIGNFDGVHLGHIAVIEAMKAEARARNLVPTVLTFEPHPRQFFAPNNPPFRLMRLSEKLAALAAQGVDVVAMPRFNATLASMAAEDFLNHMLGQQLGAKAVITGENFAFGQKRRGDSAMLNAWGDAKGVRVITVPPVRVGEAICSSSAIRAALLEGKVAEAAQLLGRPYRISGRVMHGDGRGRTLGFPTANISLESELLLPAHGVYAVWATDGNTTWAGVANLGVRPTVAVSNRTSLEVHLFDTMQEMYGKKLSAIFVDKLRDEQRFETLDALKKQITLDCNAARARLARKST
jgi:riboflavin kinase/FMN adenylyltransferase